MRMTFRWYGPSDRVTLRNIRQIPGVRGIVSAVYDVPVGEAWTRDSVSRLTDSIDNAGLSLQVVESIPVHEHIKLGAVDRDRYIEAWCESLRQVGEAGVPVVCYNFMPIFDWMRTDLAHPMADGSTTLTYSDEELARFDLTRGTGELPGWSTAYDAATLGALLDAWKAVNAEQLWEHLAYFLERVVPVADEVNVKLAIHPDDPPWSIFGLPRVITDGDALRRFLSLVDHPANGLTFCTGSLGALAKNDLPALVDEFAARGRIHFMHCRNVKRRDTATSRAFDEVPHPSEFGDVDMRGVLSALARHDYTGPMRPDHGRMIWGEEGRAGYGLHDRALGAMYLQGLWEGVRS
ncbi:mannonate dehydratase [Gemmatimonas sp.]|jgi:mannonate dehydratase|uniref:mannonate dehydratase n=1 Tax=Gemmatimonas sp. TaxID=1962908 RepID=UPI0037BEDFA6